MIRETEKTASSAKQFEVVPDELKERAQWIVWRSEQRDGRPTKVPYCVDGPHARVNDASTWTGFETAVKTYSSGAYDGIGFVFTADDPYVGVDLDDCRNPDTGELEAGALELLAELSSYSEVSPSNTGVKVFVRGELPPNGRATRDVPWPDGKFEIYDKGRFFTVTGDHVAGTPTTIEDRPQEVTSIHARFFPPRLAADRQSVPGKSVLADHEVLEKARNAANGEKFARLYDGETTAYGNDDSSADLALCNMLAFWTGGDTEQVDRLFRESGLFRPKWDDVHRSDDATYGQMTIETAIAGCTNFYTPPNHFDSYSFSRSEPERNESQVIPWREFLDMPIEDGEWIIPGILRPGWLCALGGQAKHGKTTLVLHALAGIAVGRSPFGGEIEPRPAVFLNYEMAYPDLKALVEGACESRPGADKRASVVLRPEQPPDPEWLRQELSSLGKSGVCVIDSFRAAYRLRGDSENEAGTVGRILRGLSDVARDTGWAIVVVHHFRKGATGSVEDFSGSGEWSAAVDVLWTWVRRDAEEPGIFEVTGRIPPREPIRIKLTPTGMEVLGTVVEVEQSVREQVVLDALPDDPEDGLTVPEVADLTQLPRGTVRADLKRLVDRGAASRSGKGRKGDPHRFHVPQSGDDAADSIRAEKSLGDETNRKPNGDTEMLGSPVGNPGPASVESSSP